MTSAVLALCLLITGAMPAQQQGSAVTVGSGISAPVPIKSPDPNYSSKAQKAKLEGVVVVSIVVDTDGLPKNIKITRSLGMGLDEEAIKAVKKWRFKPAIKDGKPVAVQVNVEVNFRLR
jgi:periplasmic protein TonB